MSVQVFPPFGVDATPGSRTMMRDQRQFYRDYKTQMVLPVVPDPLTISGCTLWLDASQITGLTDGTGVTTWSDVSGAGHDVTQATAGNRPLYKTNIVNGKSIVRFDGADDCLVAGAAFGSSASNTCFVVVKTVSTADCTLLSGPGNKQRRIGQNANKMSMYDGSNNPISLALGSVQSNWNVLTFQNDAGTPHFWENGTNYDNAGSLTGTETWRTVGITDTLGLTPTNGDIAEILLYTVALSTADRRTLEAYLGAKYSITVV